MKLLLVLVGLIEFALRVAMLVVMCALILPIVILTDEPHGLQEFMSPICWDLL